ncbi:MAG: hypothetical protein QXO15_02790 [Nitrososphaerota archaeon]
MRELARLRQEEKANNVIVFMKTFESPITKKSYLFEKKSSG